MAYTTEEQIKLIESGEAQKLQENGKYLIKELTIKGEKLVVRASFKTLNRAFRDLMSPKIEKGKTGIEMDMWGAGLTLLHQGGVYNQDLFMNNVLLQAAACHQLGQWIAEVLEEIEDVSGEKKSTKN